MGINQLSAFGSPISPRAFVVQNNAAQQQSAQVYGGALNFTLKATQALHIPAGNWMVQPGAYSNVQMWDQHSYLWRNLTPAPQTPCVVSSDGANFQVVNTTGGVIGAVITNAGTGGTNGFYGYNQALTAITIIGGSTTAGNSGCTATLSAGGGLLNVFVGGAISTSVTVTNGGSGFAEAPSIIVVPPASQGAQPYIPATAVVNGFSGGAITSITVTNQGAGYVAAPTFLVVPQEGDTAANYQAVVLTPTLTGSGTVTAVTVASPGTAAVATLPTIAFAGASAPASAAATALANFSIVSVAISATVGSNYGASQPTYTVATNTTAPPSPIYTNPATQLGLIQPQAQPNIWSVCAAGGTMTGSTGTVFFGGYGFYSVPTAVVMGQGTGALWTVTAGGNNDSINLLPL